MANRRKWTAKRERLFFRLLAETCNVSKALAAIGISPSSAYERKANEPDFSAKWDAAIEQAGDLLLGEAYRRAFEGVSEPVGWYQGSPGGYVQKYSDRLAEFLLDRTRFKKEGDGTGGGVVINILRFGDGDRSLLAQGTQPVITVQPEGLEEPAPITVRRMPVGKEEDDEA